MDTLVRIVVYDSRLSGGEIRAAMDRAFQKIREIEQRTSVHIDSSEIARLSLLSGRSPLTLTPYVALLLERSLYISRETGGTFDISVGAVKRLWGFHDENPCVPPADSIEAALSRVDYRRIEQKGHEFYLMGEGMELDLGGVAKGFAIDQAVETLEKAGIRSGLVEAGGDLRLFGMHPVREKWRIGIRHPRARQTDLLAIMELGEESVATSGDYERYFLKDGRRYHHILNPRTGYPAEGCISVTVIAGSALEADAYATAVFVMGPQKGMAFLMDKPGVEGLIVRSEGGALHWEGTPAFMEKATFQ
jgi:thiamine biosynthesis lipoprotein